MVSLYPPNLISFVALRNNAEPSRGARCGGSEPGQQQGLGSEGQQQSDSTGKSFRGELIRTFTGPIRLQQDDHGRGGVSENVFPRMVKEDCIKWGVVTTIHEPSKAVENVAALPGWCLVIVADTITPTDYLQRSQKLSENSNSNVIFLSVQDQKTIKQAFVHMIPYGSFARKNIGYLFAIRHGAQVIFDFDDDNVLKSSAFANFLTPPFSERVVANVNNGTNNNDKIGQSVLLRFVKSKKNNNNSDNSTTAFNPFPCMKPSIKEGVIWPRGFPISQVSHRHGGSMDHSNNDNKNSMSHCEIRFGTISISQIGVIQSVCDVDPDVDAIYRLTRELPITFDNDPTTATSLLIPSNMYTPYNAQATTHLYNSFWGLFLPFTVPGRVSDIWRSYITQFLFKQLNLFVIYTPPAVIHTRTAHDSLADLQAEDALYHKTDALLNFLKNWENEPMNQQPLRVTRTIPATLERLYVSLYEHDYIGYNDVIAMQEWILALMDMGYRFPTKPTPQQAEATRQHQLFSTAMGGGAPVIQQVPTLHGQPYLNQPRFKRKKKNRGGKIKDLFRIFALIRRETVRFRRRLDRVVGGLGTA